MPYKQETYKLLALPSVLQPADPKVPEIPVQAADLTELPVNVYFIAG